MPYPDFLQRVFDVAATRTQLNRSVIPSGLGLSANATVVKLPVCTSNHIAAVLVAGQSNTVTLVSETGITFAKIKEFLVTYDDTISVLSTKVAAIDGVAHYTVTPVAAVLGRTVSLHVRAVDTKDNTSAIAVQTFAVVDKFIHTPTLLAPLDGAIVATSAVTFIISQMVTSVPNDTHIASQFMITDMSDVTVYDSGELAGVTTHAVTALSLLRKVKYKFLARVKSAGVGWSAWSVPSIAETMSMERGTRIDNKATIIGPYEYAGALRYIAVVDAAYRVGASNMLTADLGGINSVTEKYPVAGVDYAGNGGTISTSETDAVTIARSPDPHTSKYNTDLFYKRFPANKLVAPAECRSVLLNGEGCDVPTITASMLIWKNRAWLDSVDPTVATHTSLKLATWKGTSAGYSRTSSASSYAYTAPDVLATELLRSAGDRIYSVFYAYPGFLVPVKEYVN